jgi:hypothetical protein
VSHVLGVTGFRSLGFCAIAVRKILMGVPGFLPVI